ncbi:hypothetical protein E2C01_060000 [Portunus trituberculatus]|uniref:Uncharacterized protein n=1 Tax=Portunus trituberculatus TaxID=210409 RepID=A0A5B7H6W9_PORTR|nr:hypothetical protein [Portunus trituberculatus]
MPAGGDAETLTGLARKQRVSRVAAAIAPPHPSAQQATTEELSTSDTVTYKLKSSGRTPHRRPLFIEVYHLPTGRKPSA